MTSPRNTIIQGDCPQILPQLAADSVQFILTDPPYITRYRSWDSHAALSQGMPRSGADKGVFRPA